MRKTETLHLSLNSSTIVGMVPDTVTFLVILCFNLVRGVQHYLVTAIIKSSFVF